MSDCDHLTDPLRKDIEAVILARLEAKSSHDYQWPRWAAANEASHAVMRFVESLVEPEHAARPPHPDTMIGRGQR